MHDGRAVERKAASVHSSGVFVVTNQGQILAEDVGTKNGRPAPPLREKSHAHHKAVCWRRLAAFIVSLR